MANPDSTNASELPSFTVLKGHERRAVILKGEGKTNAQIAAHINNEFTLEYSDRTVQEWFIPNGRLFQALMEFNEAQAALSLKEARQLIKKATRGAAATLISQLANPDAHIAQGAAKALLNKYIPDKQIQLDNTFQEEDLPEELAAVADALQEDADGSKPVDEPPVGGENSEAAGS